MKKILILHPNLKNINNPILFAIQSIHLYDHMIEIQILKSSKCHQPKLF